MRYSALGMTEFENIRVVPEMKVVEFDHTDLDAKFEYRIPIEAGTFVLGVGTYVKEALAGGAATMTVGDSVGADDWATDALCIPDSLDKFFFSQGSTVDNKNGKYYATADSILVTCVTGLTAGKIKILVLMFRLDGNWRQPDL
jgi:hypothetical protein